MKEYEESLSVPSHVERLDDQVHGFMSARADLKDYKVKAGYEISLRSSYSTSVWRRWWL